MSKLARFLAFALIVSLPASMAAAGVEFLPIDSIKPGMKCTGRTVFEGSRIEEFQCEIIGVLRNMGPNQNAIIARTSGHGLEKTGIFQGMSGSPVYVDGKLIGAVAWSVAFATEPIAGITPIQEMVELFQEGDLQPRIRIGARMRPTWENIIGGEAPTLAAAAHLPERVLALPDGLTGAGTGMQLRPIATPVAFSGFTPQAIQRFAPQFQMLGMTPMQGGGGGARGPARADATLEPGATVSVSLISGDMDVSAAGTVTHREGQTVYAFGHPFLNLGGTEMPMSRAEVLTVLPSLQVSSKLASGTEVVGVIRQDRATGIQGTLGQSASLIPVAVTVNNERGRARHFQYQVINDKFLTPFLLNLTVYNTILSSERGLGYSTLNVKGRIALDGQPDINIENSFSSNSNSPVSASLAVAGPVSFLLASGYENLRFKEISLEIHSFEDAREAILERVWYNRTEANPGNEVRLDVFLRKDNGEEIVESYPIKIPEDVPPGPLSVLVGDGESLERHDARETPGTFIPKDLGQLVKLINNFKKQDRLYVRLYRRERGAVVRGEGLPGLPPSILTLLNSPKTQGGMDPINISTFIEYELPATDYVITGMNVVTIQVRS